MLSQILRKLNVVNLKGSMEGESVSPASVARINTTDNSSTILTERSDLKPSSSSSTLDTSDQFIATPNPVKGASMSPVHKKERRVKAPRASLCFRTYAEEMEIFCLELQHIDNSVQIVEDGIIEALISKFIKRSLPKYIAKLEKKQMEQLPDPRDLKNLLSSEAFASSSGRDPSSQVLPTCYQLTSKTFSAKDLMYSHVYPHQEEPEVVLVPEDFEDLENIPEEIIEDPVDNSNGSSTGEDAAVTEAIVQSPATTTRRLSGLLVPVGHNPLLNHRRASRIKLIPTSDASVISVGMDSLTVASSASFPASCPDSDSVVAAL
jgi:hypothetical protein